MGDLINYCSQQTTRNNDNRRYSKPPQAAGSPESEYCSGKKQGNQKDTGRHKVASLELACDFFGRWFRTRKNAYR